jgi:hypothetical protein
MIACIVRFIPPVYRTYHSHFINLFLGMFVLCLISLHVKFVLECLTLIKLLV